MSTYPQASCKLIVDLLEKTSDNSVATMHVDDMENLDAFRGDIVVLNKGRRYSMLAICPHSKPTDLKSTILINSCAMKNLRAKTKDIVNVSTDVVVPYGSAVRILPISDTVPIHPVHEILQRYFYESYRPALEGERFTTHQMEFRIMSVQPKTQNLPYAAIIVASHTKIYCDGPPIPRFLIEPTWTIQRLLWIGHLKEDASCGFAIVPKDVVRVIQEYYIHLMIDADLDYKEPETAEESSYGMCLIV